VHDDNVAQDGSVFLVMELLEGETILDRANRALIDPYELLRWMDEVLDVLAAAHTAGIVHRDLKPDNIFLTTAGRIKVLDFGIARVSDALPRNFRTRTGTALGTGPYMSPEQAVGKLGAIDGRSDLFSVGATMFRLLTRRRVHEVDKESDLLMAMATKPAPPIAPLAVGLPPGTAAIIDRALAFLPSRRYPDARTMQTDVRAVLSGNPPPYATAQIAAGRDPWVTHDDVPEAAAPHRAVPTTIPEPPAPRREAIADAAPPWARPPEARARRVASAAATVSDRAAISPARAPSPPSNLPPTVDDAPALSARAQPPSSASPVVPGVDSQAGRGLAAAPSRDLPWPSPSLPGDRPGSGRGPRQGWWVGLSAVVGFALGFALAAAYIALFVERGGKASDASERAATPAARTSALPAASSPSGAPKRVDVRAP
jgi:serine/threonine protein kinase